VSKIKKLMRLLKSVKLLLVATFAFGFVKANAQINNEAKAATVANEHTKAPITKVSNASPLPQGHSVSNAKSVLNENDQYQGRSQEFLQRLTVKEIPADFPKYKPGYGTKYYNDLVDGYYVTHPAIVQKWVTDKLNRKKN
jgi:hypothetical protein